MNMQAHPKPDAETAPALPRHDAYVLTDNGGLAEIVLGDQIYRLRITKAEKLILTK